MKKIIFIFLIQSLCLCTFDSYCDTISVKQAMEEKMVKVVLIKSYPLLPAVHDISAYTGDCIKMHVENMTDKSIKIFLEAGRFLFPDDTAEQRMIVTRDQMITLYKKQKKELVVYAMCSEMHDSTPDSASTFEMGSKAEGDLLKLAQLISKNNWQDMTAQSAIWSITDGNDYSDIYSDNNKTEMTALRDFVKKSKGIITPIQPQGNDVFKVNTESENTYLKYKKGEVTGSFEFSIKEDLSLSMRLYNEQGEEFKKGFSNLVFKKGINTITYTYIYYNIPLGNYYVKLLDDTGSVFLEKMLTFK